MRRVIVVDPDPCWTDAVRDMLREVAETVPAANYNQAAFCAQERAPDAIILDTPSPAAQDIRRRFKDDSATRNVPVVMLTGMASDAQTLAALPLGEDAVLRKDHALLYLPAMLKMLFERPGPPLFDPPPDEVTLSLLLGEDGVDVVRLTGSVFHLETMQRREPLAFSRWANWGETLAAPQWLESAIAEGQSLLRQLFAAERIRDTYNIASGFAKELQNLRLRLVGSRQSLAAPFEVLFQESSRQFLALQHPLARSITGYVTNRAPMSRAYLNDRLARREPLRALLIASDPNGELAVDDEIDAVKACIERSFERLRLAPQVQTIHSKEATLSNVMRALEKCPCDIVHYAGHGSFEPGSPDRSYLPFIGQESGTRSIGKLTATDLRNLLEGSRVRLFYASCCRSGSTASAESLRGSEFLGIADALLQAKLPCVLTFRFLLSDAEAVQFAEWFYRGLAQTGEPDMALLAARRRAFRTEPLWGSPILIVQR